MRPRIILADDHILVAEAFRKLLEPEYEIVAVVGDGRALVTTALREKPDLMVVDIAMPLLNGLDAAAQIKEALPSVKVVYLTMNPSVELAAEALKRKASGYVLKNCAASELIVALRTVLQGGTYFSSTIAKDVADFVEQQKKDVVEERMRLTERQREVLQLLAEGKSMREAATVLNVSPRTVAFHKYRLMELLRLKDNTELMQYAMKHNLVF
jgi:DNA-binding NarL/FixJ family response regulator